MTNERLLQIIEEAKKNNDIILSFANENLEKLPTKLWELTDLQFLNLLRIHLTKLPSEIQQLKNLRELSLDGNQLTELPSEIEKLKNLRKLYLNENQLTKLPLEIKQLINLKTLFLNGNKLTKLPSEISQLINLQEFSLARNQLTELPPEIGQLKNLRKLSLSGNQLTKLPLEIVSLTNLQVLSLAGNQLTELPPEIEQLTNLRELFLAGNQLTKLPAEIIQLTNLQILYLTGNDQLLKRIPKEVIKDFSNPIRILSNYFEIDESLFLRYKDTPEKLVEIIKAKQNALTKTKPLLEGRIIIIGQGNAGKTSLKQRLLPNLEYQNKGKTEGIEISPWELEINNQKVKLNVWDFGGQEIYHTTHQFFFRERCLYLLVVDVRAGMEKIICKYWLRQIKELAKDNAPLILIANKAELHKPEENWEHNDEGLDKRYYASVEDRLKEFKAIYKNIRSIHFVSAEVPLNIEQVKKEIIEAVKENLREVFYEYKPEYALTKDIINEQGEDFIAKDKLHELISRKNFDEKFKQAEGQRDLVRVLDTLGTITHFEGDDLEDLYILKPEWITKGVYKILSSYKLNATKGKPTVKEVKDILNNTKYQGKEKYIIQLMKKFSLCFVKTEQGEERLIFPAWLPVEEPPFSPFIRNISRFEYQYKRDSSVEKFITIFIVDKSATNDLNTYWRHGVVLRENNCRALIKADTEAEKITITVEGEITARKMFLENIKNYFSALHEKFNNPVQEEKDFEPEKTSETIKPDDGFNAIQIREDFEQLQNQLETLEKDRNKTEQDKQKIEQEKQKTETILKLTNDKAKLAEIKQNLDGKVAITWFFIKILIGVPILLGLFYWVRAILSDWDKINPHLQSAQVIGGVVIVIVVAIILGIFGGREVLKSKTKRVRELREETMRTIAYKWCKFPLKEYQEICQELEKSKPKERVE